MARFVQIPPLDIGRSGQWILTAELIYESDLMGIVRVPREFETDLASIPRVFQPLIQQDGNHRPAAIVHDYLCRSKIVRRKTADRVFLEAMQVAGERKWRRGAMYSAVRLYSLWLGLWERA